MTLGLIVIGCLYKREDPIRQKIRSTEGFGSSFQALLCVLTFLKRVSNLEVGCFDLAEHGLFANNAKSVCVSHSGGREGLSCVVEMPTHLYLSNSLLKTPFQVAPCLKVKY